MTTALNKLPDNSFELTITVPWTDIKTTFDQIVDRLLSEVEIEGFRKGKAPRDLALKNLDQGKIYGQVVNEILPKVYSQAIEEQKLQPITSPKVQILAADPDKDWVFKATSCEKPAIDLGDYKAQIKTAKIWKPGDDIKKEDAEEKSKRINEIISKLIESAKITLPAILVESEEERLLAQLIDDVRAAGLTYDQYLASKGATADGVKSQYHTQAEAALKLEFILEEIAKIEKISVSQEEIEAVINKEKDPKGQENLRKQSYLLASIMRREKTLTYLSNL